MKSVTLDTSCALNFLNTEEQADAALIGLMRLAYLGRLDVVVTEEAVAEVSLTDDDALREERLKRLSIFNTLRVPRSRQGERDTLAGQLEGDLFGQPRAGSRQAEHNARDCRQLAAHAVIGRDLFVTTDHKLAKKAAKAELHRINLLEPAGALALIEQERAVRSAAFRPAISVREWDREHDEGDVRHILASLRELYPGFDDWLNSRLEKPDSHFLIGEYEGRPGAVSLTVEKDARVVKLAAFTVAEFARNTGLGPHLLWAEIRRWVQSGYEKAYVTVSSQRADLLRFFADFGFLVEGVSPRRYFDNDVEFVLGKHILRRRLTEADADEFVSTVADHIFRIPPNTQDVPRSAWTLPTEPAAPLSLINYGDAMTLTQAAGEQPRSWDVLQLERMFHPLRIATSGRRVLLIPIEQRWADALLEYPEQQRQLMQDERQKLLLRWDNAYYCFPKSLDLAREGTPILFYVKAPVMAIVGEARLFAAEVDRPQYLFLKFGDIGVYTLGQIAQHVQTHGPNRGNALALRFGMYVPFVQRVSLSDLRTLLGHPRFTGPQGLMPISFKDFERIREKGGLEW